MAESIALQKPDVTKKVLLLVGQFHIEYNGGVVQELKKRLSIIENLSIRYGIDKRMEEERYRRIKLNSATVKIGMTIPEVMDIIGDPVEIIHEQTLHGGDAQLWLYHLSNDRNLELSFYDYKLFKIE